MRKTFHARSRLQVAAYGQNKRLTHIPQIVLPRYLHAILRKTCSVQIDSASLFCRQSGTHRGLYTYIC